LSLLHLLVAEASSRSWRQLTDYLYNQDSKKKPQNSKVANSFFAPTWKAAGHIQTPAYWFLNAFYLSQDGERTVCDILLFSVANIFKYLQFTCQPQIPLLLYLLGSESNARTLSLTKFSRLHAPHHECLIPFS
jgi:hypothetical protein